MIPVEKLVDFTREPGFRDAHFSSHPTGLASTRVQNLYRRCCLVIGTNSSRTNKFPSHLINKEKN